MKKNFPFDEHVKKQFSDFEPEVPSHIWKNIIAEKDKRKPGFLFSLAAKRFKFLLLILLVTGSGTLLFYSMYKNNSGEKIVAGKTSSTIEGNDSENKTTIENGNTNEIKILAAPDQSRSAEVDKNIFSQKAGNVSSDTPDPTFKTVTRQKNSPVIHKNKSSLSQYGDNKYSERGQAFIPKEKNNFQHVNGKKDLAIISPAGEAVEENLAETKTADANNDDETFLNKYILNLNIISSERIVSPVKNINMSPLNIPCPRSVKNTGANKKYLEIYGGPDYAFRSFDDTANSAYLKKRKESTSFSSAFSFGIRFTKVFNNSVSLRTGINYSQVNEKFKFEQGHLVQHIYTTDINGDTTGSSVTTGTRYKTTYNNYRTIDIPVLIGYEFGNGKLHANINGGPVINIYSWQKGDVLDTAYQPVNITTGKGSSPYQFKTNTGIGFMGAASIYYKFSGCMSVLAEPYIRYNFSPASKATLTFKQKYTTAGLRLGLRIDF